MNLHRKQLFETLLVEDNPHDAELVIRTLQRSSLANHLVHVSDGQSALDFLFGTGIYKGRNVQEQPKVVLLDLKLPKFDGLEVLRRIRADKRTHLVPVVILTSSREDCDIVSSYRLGANSYIVKPVDFDAFTETVTKTVLYWLKTNVATTIGSSLMKASHKLRILSLEDSVLDAEIIQHELKQGEIDYVWTRVETRADYARAIQEFQPELILADYKLPAFDGQQALAMAKEHCPDVPVIMISGAVGEETAVELLKTGATDFVLKDRLGRLVPAVKRALREVESQQARHKAEDDLHSLNAQLEHRVIERTRELWEKNTVMEEDLEMARELQMAFLPSRFPTIPRGVSETASAVRFCSVFHPSGSVSGDFYNIVRISDTSVGIFICDVMGHGVRAALVTAIMRALEEQLGDAAANPGILLTQMNHSLRDILRQLTTTLFATACYIIVDIATGRLTFANAGHPNPLLVHHATKAVEIIGADHKHGPALGLVDDIAYQTYELKVDEGDLVLAFTDGLFEVENTQSQAFSETRLRDAIHRRVGLPLTKLVQDLSHEIEDFAKGQSFTDDVCLVGMEIAWLNGRIAGAA